QFRDGPGDVVGLFSEEFVVRYGVRGPLAALDIQAHIRALGFLSACYPGEQTRLLREATLGGAGRRSPAGNQYLETLINLWSAKIHVRSECSPEGLWDAA